MAIQAKCRNILRYDKDAGEYVYCGCTVTVGSDQIGSTVECPDCGSAIEVLPPEPQQIESGPSDALDDVVAESTQSNWTYEPPPETERSFARTQIPCINCHTSIPISAESCPECGYRQPIDETPEAAGLQLWIGSWLTDDASPLLVLAVGSALFCVLAVLCLSYTLIQYGAAQAICLLTPFVLVLIVSLIVLLSGRRSGEPWSAAARRVFNPMSAILAVCRASSWREPGWPFRSREFLDSRNRQLNDQDLLEDGNLDRYEAMDLEGTQITDSGLDYLLTAQALKFVVLRHTQTTADGIKRLQNRRPDLWIWS